MKKYNIYLLLVSIVWCGEKVIPRLEKFTPRLEKFTPKLQTIIEEVGSEEHLIYDSEEIKIYKTGMGFKAIKDNIISTMKQEIKMDMDKMSLVVFEFGDKKERYILCSTGDQCQFITKQSEIIDKLRNQVNPIEGYNNQLYYYREEKLIHYQGTLILNCGKIHCLKYDNITEYYYFTENCNPEKIDEKKALDKICSSLGVVRFDKKKDITIFIEGISINIDEIMLKIHINYLYCDNRKKRDSYILLDIKNLIEAKKSLDFKIKKISNHIECMAHTINQRHEKCKKLCLTIAVFFFVIFIINLIILAH